MSNIITFSKIRFWITVVSIVFNTTAGWGKEVYPEVRIPLLKDLSADLKLSQDSGRPVMLVFSAEHCFYCGRLKENIIKPMLRSGDYDHRVIIRTLEIDDYSNIKGSDGNETTTSALANHYKVRVTPTVILLGPDGTEVAERQLGINNEDYYGAYLDKEIEAATKTIASGKR